MAQANANELFDEFSKFGGAPIIEIGGRAGVGASLLDQIANEVLGVVAKRAVGLGAEGVERVAGPGLESLLVEANLHCHTGQPRAPALDHHPDAPCSIQLASDSLSVPLQCHLAAPLARCLLVPRMLLLAP